MVKQLSHLKVKKLSEFAILPTRTTETDSGFDLFASEDVIIEPGETAVIPTGIAVELPEGMEAQVRPRSGVTSKTDLRVQLGTIDNDYRGEIGIIIDNSLLSYGVNLNIVNLINGDRFEVDTDHDIGSYYIRKGDKIAQLVVQYLPTVDVVEVKGELSESKHGRGDSGFGSSGYSCTHERSVGGYTSLPESFKCLDCGEFFKKDVI